MREEKREKKIMLHIYRACSASWLRLHHVCATLLVLAASQAAAVAHVAEQAHSQLQYGFQYVICL